MCNMTCPDVHLLVLCLGLMLSVSISYRIHGFSEKIMLPQGRKSTLGLSVLRGKKKSRIEKEEAALRKKSQAEKRKATDLGPIDVTLLEEKPISTIVDAGDGYEANENDLGAVDSLRNEMGTETVDNTGQPLQLDVNESALTTVSQEESDSVTESSSTSLPSTSSSPTFSSSVEESYDEGDEIVMIEPLPGQYRTSIRPLRVPRDNPTNSNIPPEVVFFGEPRRPPPVEMAKDFAYHQILLDWARHAPVAPVTSEDRLNTVFPRGRLADESNKYRLSTEQLTYETIKEAFLPLKDDLEALKSFIAANVDIIPPSLFLRAYTAEKLEAQSKQDITRMNAIIEARRKYILARDQLFFPMEIEMQKAETRVMTYLARAELVEFAKNWDSVEISLHMLTLLAARRSWDDQCKEIKSEIDQKLAATEKYMQKQTEESLIFRYYQDPVHSSYVYGNASLNIEMNMYDDVYVNVRPEIKAIHETYAMDDDAEKRRYLTEILCPRESINVEQLKENLLILEASLGALENCDFIRIRQITKELYDVLASPQEREDYVKWFKDYSKNGYGFSTYEADDVENTLPILEKLQRLRDTGNAFSNFQVEILNQKTKYTEWNSGRRKKGREVGNWLEIDKSQTISVSEIETPEKVLKLWKETYIENSQRREEDEERRDAKKLLGR